MKAQQASSWKLPCRGGGGVGRSGGLYVRPLGEERRVPLDANDGPERCPPHERERAWQQAHL